MKRLLLVAVVALAVLLLTSCGAGFPRIISPADNAVYTINNFPGFYVQTDSNDTDTQIDFVGTIPPGIQCTPGTTPYAGCLRGYSGFGTGGFASQSEYVVVVRARKGDNANFVVVKFTNGFGTTPGGGMPPGTPPR